MRDGNERLWMRLRQPSRDRILVGGITEGVQEADCKIGDSGLVDERTHARYHRFSFRRLVDCAVSQNPFTNGNLELVAGNRFGKRQA